MKATGRAGMIKLRVANVRMTAVVATILWFLAASFAVAGTLRIASYNVENYLDAPADTRPAKSAAARAKVRESIRAANPDILALQEIGSQSALAELQRSLELEGLPLPYSDWIQAADTNIHIAVLSRFPFAARRPHTNDFYLLGGRRFGVSRGFAELDIGSGAGRFTLIAAHLKSQRPVPEADQAEQRAQEARLLRKLIDRRLADNPDLNLVVLGDFNDNRDSPSIRTLLGRGRTRLIDTRPAERPREPASAGSGGIPFRTVAWTHYYGKEDSWSRLDYILLSPAMARRWISQETFIPIVPGWGEASDHRPIVAAFHFE
ncbi:MAG: endonuclease/exonuclease/phosphatase family protein [Verrucomicrobiota bacterium]